MGEPVVVWQDYVCPWAYLGRHRSRLLEELGLVVEPRPFELHPELPADGRPVRPGGRFAAVLARIGAECAALDIPFRAPSRTPNTRLALELAEVVRDREPATYAAVDDALFAARFVDDADLADHATLRRVLLRVGLPDTLLDDALAGVGRRAVESSMAWARETGVAATPAWRFPSGFVIPGVQPVDHVRRWATRLIEAERAAGRIDPDG